jgi:hypothetical protein
MSDGWSSPVPLLLQALDVRIAWWAPADARAWLLERLADLVIADGDAATADAATADVQFTWTAVDGDLRCVHGDAHMQSASPNHCLAEAMIEINRLAAASVAAERLVLHAGVVSPEPGRAIAVCGRSGAGKSTATTAAVLAGWGFVADEVCALHPDTFEVRPYPRPIGLRFGGAQALGLDRDRGIRQDDVFRAPVLVTDPPVLEHVVLLARRPGPPELRRLSPAAALEELANHTLGGDGLERHVFRRLEHLVRSVPVAVAEYESAPELIDALRSCDAGRLDDPRGAR